MAGNYQVTISGKSDDANCLVNHFILYRKSEFSKVWGKFMVQCQWVRAPTAKILCVHRTHCTNGSSTRLSHLSTYTPSYLT